MAGKYELTDAINALTSEASGTAAITTFPAAAAPADGVSLAAVVRKNYDLIDAIDVATIDGYHDVPTKDSTDDAQMRDVIGKKDDTTVQDADTDKSILAYVKGICNALTGTAGVGAWPTGAAPANGVNIAEVLAYLVNAQQGTTGIVTWPAGAAAASGVSMAEALRYASEYLVAALTKPATDDASDDTIWDAIGIKADTAAGTSLVALAKQILAALSTVDGLLDVPTQNLATNATINQVVGNKTDTSAGTSLVALAQQLLARLVSPTADLVTDTTPAYTIGLKADTVSGTSLVSLAKQLLARLVSPTADLATDTTPAYTIGLKADTVAGTSLVSLAKQILAALVTVDGLLDVPTEDLATDATINQVVGKKSDTVAGTSLVALAKQILAALVVVDAFHDVATADAATNVVMSDVIGNKDDTVAGTSLVSKHKQAQAVIKTGVKADNTIPNNLQTAGGLLATATGGDVWIEKIILSKDNANLTGPTNIEISCDNVYGVTGVGTVLAANVLAGLNAQLTLDCASGGVVAFVPFTLESGKKIYIEGDDAAGTSLGNYKYTIIGRAASAGAYLA